MLRTRGLTCCSCGNAVDLAAGQVVVSCGSCGVKLAVAGGTEPAAYMVLDAVGRSRAEDVMRSWLRRGNGVHPEVARCARTTEVFLAWFPFLHARYDLVGWVFGSIGQTRERDPAAGRMACGPEQVEREVEHAIERTFPAVDMGAFEVEQVDLANRELLPFDEQVLAARGMVFRPSLSPRAGLAKLVKRSIGWYFERNPLEKKSFSSLEPIGAQLAMVYYPLWVIRYRFRHRLYQVIVDAADGSVVFANAPGDRMRRASLVLAACAALCFSASTLVRGVADGTLAGLLGLVSNRDARDFAFVVFMYGNVFVFGLLVSALTVMYRRFRRGGTVEQCPGRQAVVGEVDSSFVRTTVRIWFDTMFGSR